MESGCWLRSNKANENEVCAQGNLRRSLAWKPALVGRYLGISLAT